MTLQQRSAPGEGPTKPAILAQLARIQASPHFVNAPRLRQLLAYLVENSAGGRRRDLLEFAIGVEVFGRGDDFDPQSDTIVRVTVRRLRQHLADYYRNEGRDDRVRFQIPVGHYRVAISVPQLPLQPALRAWAYRYRTRLALPAAASVVLAALLIIQYGGPSAAEGNQGVRPDLETVRHVLLGQQLLHRRGPGDPLQAVEEFEQAVEKDADNIEAWVGLASALRVRSYEGPEQFDETMPKQFWALEHALALDPTHPEANARMAALRYLRGDKAGAAWYLARALEFGSDNNLVLSMIAGQERASGNLEGAIELQRKATEYPPLDAVSFTNLGDMLYEAGDLDGALNALYTAAKISPRQPVMEATIIKALILKGDLPEAGHVLKQMPPGAARQQALALFHYAAGNTDESERALQALADQPRSVENGIWLAEAFAFRGETDLAMDAIESTYGQIMQRNEPRMEHCFDLQLILNSPYLATLSMQPRFQAFANRAEAFVASMRPEILTLATLQQQARL